MSHFILDCDPGHDDALAILVAAHHLDLVGVTTVFGNSSVGNTTQNALDILDAAGMQHVPVAAGAAGPLTGKRKSAEAVHGKSGLDGANLPRAKREPVNQDAPEFIASMAEKHDDLVIIAVAPQTNIATALRRYPELHTRVMEISIMGGSTSCGNATPAAEFNILADPEAAAEVFVSPIPKRMAGLNVTTTFGITADQLVPLRSSSAVIPREISGALTFYLDRQNSMYARDFAAMHDVCAVIPYCYPDLIVYEHLHVAVECKGELTRGMTLCDLRGTIAQDGIQPAAPANTRVAVAADGNSIVAVVLDTLSNFS